MVYFFSQTRSNPQEWKGWLASKQKLLDELTADDDYDPFDASPECLRLKSRLRGAPLIADDDCDPFSQAYDDYDPSNTSPESLRHESRLCEVPLIADNGDDSFNASPGH